MDAKKRQEIRAELAGQGYAWDYVDSWPPKVTLYVHRALLNPEGQVTVERGTALPNHPGHPDHLARKSRIGLLAWPPSKTCRCKACREQNDPQASEAAAPMDGANAQEAAVSVDRRRPGRPRKESVHHGA